MHKIYKKFPDLVTMIICIDSGKQSPPRLSITLMILLAFDLAIGVKRNDFLSFAIQRNPGFDSNHSNWFPNGIGFGDPAPEGKNLPISYRPIQKFMR